MARRERPLDPADGPLEAFAHDLRALRSAAGEPTYRRLAQLAGYSASTLSEAASGARLPTLAVTLAFVGACSGDTGAWEHRWTEVRDALQAADDASCATSVEPCDKPFTPDDLTMPYEPSDAGEPSVPEPRPASGEPDERRAPGEPAAPGERSAPDERTGIADEGDAGGGGEAARPEIVRSDAPAVRPPALHAVRPIIIGPAATGRAGRNIAAVTVGCLLVAGLVALGLNGPWRSGGDKAGGGGTAGGCPPMPMNPKFTAVAYGDGAPVRAGAALDRPAVATYPPGCVLGFTGFCIGQKVTDRTAGIPDSRWFVLPDGRVVPSALVHGNPPTHLTPAACADARKAPKRLALKAVGPPAPDSRVVLTATGPDLQIAGFAAYYAADPAAPELRLWHQIGLTGTAAPALSVAWRPDRLPAPFHAGERVLIAAVACLGGGDTGYAASMASLTLPGPRDAAALAPRSTTVDASARRAACQYPSAS